MPKTCFKESSSLRILYFGLSKAAGTDDPEVMNDLYWNLD
ncbi:hypothetical protein HMPREF1154_1587 [Capnocytophaga sp. CM59]|nr:hypothetical protein HMPREF1154_1587 [Capnocytophaga sp. CM59]